MESNFELAGTELNASLTDASLIFGYQSSDMSADTNYTMSESIENFRFLIIMATEIGNTDAFYETQYVPVQYLKQRYGYENSNGSLFLGIRSAYITYGFTSATVLQPRAVSGATIRRIYGVR